MTPLKLGAFDAEDVGVVSAHLQDALIRTGDIAWKPRERRFAFVASRFVREDGTARHHERRRTGVHFEGVRAVKSHRIAAGDGDGMLSLLSLRFEPGEAPGGTISIEFSGGGTLKLDVEFIEAWLRDLGPAWQTGKVPDHDR